MGQDPHKKAKVVLAEFEVGNERYCMTEQVVKGVHEFVVHRKIVDSFGTPYWSLVDLLSPKEDANRSRTYHVIKRLLTVLEEYSEIIEEHNNADCVRDVAEN